MDTNWKFVEKYFADNPQALITHHLDSYNDFFENGIKNIFKEKNPIKIMKQQDPETKEFNLQCNIYLGGKLGNKLYYGKPVIYDDDRSHFMFPNEARLRNMTYGLSVHFDVDVEFKIKDDTETIEHSITLEKIYLGNFPIMLMSDLCILNSLDRMARFNMGECKNDRGGYFIIDGKEKVIISQEKFADNTLYIRDKGNELYSHSAEIRTVSEDASKPVRTMGVKIVSPSPRYTNNQLVVSIPNVRKPIPLFIVMRALGVISDKEIIKYCLLDLDQNASFVELFVPSIHDAGKIFNQESALKYIGSFTKGKTVSHAMEILMNYFLPNIGELNFKDKAYYLGYIVNRLLRVYTGEEKATDRDNFEFKRVELPGDLIYDLFNEYYTLHQRHIFQTIDKEYYFHEGTYQKNFVSLIENNYKEIFKERITEQGFKKAFKGNWGSEAHTKRMGVVQDLNRLSYNSALSHLRKINLPLDASAKVIGPRLLHSSQWGIIDPVDTPDGGNIGLHKHMAIAAKITNACSIYPMIHLLRTKLNMQLLEECTPEHIYTLTKIFVGGKWAGVVIDPVETMRLLKIFKQSALIPVYTSISWNIPRNEIQIYTDSGRMIRPVFYIDEKRELSINRANIKSVIDKNEYTWSDLISGFLKKKDENFKLNKCKIYDASTLYGTNLEKVYENRGVVEYIDCAEENTYLIAMKEQSFTNNHYTHMEIHPSMVLGVMGNQIVFPENNQLPRDLFSCGQSKQAVSLYHSNFKSRIDKMGVVLNYGQIPLVKSRYMSIINNEEHPYGENCIVAIMCYGGYNVEDAILFNEGSVKRGMFRTTYYNMYESREDSSKVASNLIDSHFANIEQANVVNTKPGYDYSALDKYGIIKENTKLDDKKVIIGKTINNLEDPENPIDASVFPKKGQLGHVDKTFITEGEEGFRLAKVRIREDRVPAIGDKFCSRCGQKGTCGLVIPEKDMPFTSEGIKPDLIINPHALPSRMTIGQLVESLMGKACALKGGFGDCTAFMNTGPKNKVFGKVLNEMGYNSSGNEVLYNGSTGEQMGSEIFIEPTYYMRLKHMVKDKINYRAQGPRTVLTRQTVQGRANDGGLRIGEMERDGIIGHGAAKFLEESMMVRGDEYHMAVCNKTGTIAIYNKPLNLFLSPMADGPIKYNGNLEGTFNVENISKFGRSFSIVRIPYSFKLLIQELQTMNVQMRIITEDNIEQIDNLSHSDNIKKLLYDPTATPQEVIDLTKRELGYSSTDVMRSTAPKQSESRQSSARQSESRQSAPQPMAFQPKYTAIPPPPSIAQKPFYTNGEGANGEGANGEGATMPWVPPVYDASETETNGDLDAVLESRRVNKNDMSKEENNDNGKFKLKTEVETPFVDNDPFASTPPTQPPTQPPVNINIKADNATFNMDNGQTSSANSSNEQQITSPQYGITSPQYGITSPSTTTLDEPTLDETVRENNNKKVSFDVKETDDVNLPILSTTEKLNSSSNNDDDSSEQAGGKKTINI